MNVLTLDSVCQFCLNEQLEMRNGCSGFAPHPVEPRSLKAGMSSQGLGISS